MVARPTDKTTQLDPATQLVIATKMIDARLKVQRSWTPLVALSVLSGAAALTLAFLAVAVGDHDIAATGLFVVGFLCWVGGGVLAWRAQLANDALVTDVREMWRQLRATDA